jgi:putative transposase
VNHDREVIENHVLRLRAMRDGGKSIPTFAVDQTAGLFGVSRATMWRWIKNGAPASEGRRHRLTKKEIALYYDLRGSVAAVARALAGQPGAPSRQTLQRAFTEQLTSEERAYVKHGTEGARSKSLYLRYEVDARNQRWESDHKQLPIMVRPRLGMRPVKPWATLFEDAKTRAIMGAAIVPRRPTRAEVLAALRSSVLVDPDRGPFGGVPDVLVWDNGLEFTSNDVNQLALELGCTVAPTTAYTPTEKGKIERLNRTLEQELISTLPFYSDGPKAANKKHFGPKNVDPMFFEQFAEIFFEWVWHYNNERQHSALDGRSPLEAWVEDATPIRELEPAELRWMMPSQNRKVLKDGIHFEGRIFWASDLIGLIDETVEIRYMPYDYRQVEVFLDGKWLTTAVPPGEVTAEDRERFYKARRDERKRAAGRMRASSRRSAARLIALTEAGALEDGDPVAAEEEKRIEKRRTRKLGAADLELLGLDGLYEVDDDVQGSAPAAADEPKSQAEAA